MNGTAANYMAGSLGIGTTSLTGYNLLVSKNITGGISAYGIQSSGQIQSDVTSQAYYFLSGASTQAASFTLANLAHYVADQGTFGASSTVYYQYGFRVRSTLTGGTLGNQAFKGEIPSGANRWNIYMDGTAANYMNGNLLLGSTTDGGQKLQVTGDSIMTGSGNTSATTALTIRNSDGTTMFRFLNDGELRLGNLGGSAPIIYTSDTASAFGFNLNGRDLVFNSRHTTQEAVNGMFSFTGTNYSLTSGSAQVISIVRTFEPTSGTGVFNLLQIRPSINQTGGANGITRGLYINPTLTSAADWRAIEVSAGVSVMAASSTASASIRIPSGTAPTSPVNGDIW